MRRVLPFVVSVGLLTFAQMPAYSQIEGVKKSNLALCDHGANERKGEDGEAVLFFGQNFEGDGIFYCLDRSGSTCSGELEVEKREVNRNIQEFSSHVEFAVVFYDSGVRKFPASDRPAQASAANKAAGVAFVTSTPCGNGTCVKRGLLACLEFADFSSAQRKRIIYVGDGGTTCPGADPREYANNTLAEVNARNVENVSIDVIHVGLDDNFFSRQLAAQNMGTFTRVIHNVSRGQIPGDSNQDTKLNISDALHLLILSFVAR